MALRRVETHLSNPALQQRYYGDLRWADESSATARSHVVFTWKYTTQTTVTDMLDVAQGLNGNGRLRNLATVAPNFRLGRAHPLNIDTCPVPAAPYVVSRDELIDLARSLLPVLGFQGAQAQSLIDSFQWVETIGRFHAQERFEAGDDGQHDGNDIHVRALQEAEIWCRELFQEFAGVAGNASVDGEM